jgi:hypothetical protein
MEINFIERPQNISLQELKCSEINVTEEYCCAITKAVGISCCGQQDSIELEFGPHLNPVVCTVCLFKPTYNQSIFRQNSPSVGPSRKVTTP